MRTGVILGVAAMITGMYLSLTNGMTGNVISESVGRVVSVYGILLVLVGIVALFTESLEGMAEEGSGVRKKSLLRRAGGWIGTRLVGGAVVGGAAAYGGYAGGEALKPYAKPVERAIQISREIGSGIVPGSGKFNEAARKRYMESSGDYGKVYLAKRSERNGEYLENAERALVNMQDTVGSKTKDLTEKVPGVNEAQGLKDKIYTGVGKIFGSKNIEKRSEPVYRDHVKELAKLRINALIRLRQLNSEIDRTTGEMAGRAAKPGENREVTKYLGNLAREANDIYGFLDSAESLTAEQIYKGRQDRGYEQIRDVGAKIKDAGYPQSDKLPFYGAVAAGVLGAGIGMRRRPSKIVVESGRGVGKGVYYAGKGIGKGVYHSGKGIKKAGKAIGGFVRKKSGELRK